MPPPPIVAAWADTALQALRTPFPYAAAHASLAGDDVDVTPTRLHPAFHGCFDWHSSCHMQWALVRLLATGVLPAPTAAQATAELDGRLTPERVRAEVDYLRARPSFERPYGWAWAAMLAASCRHAEVAEAAGWASATAGLADLIAELVPHWLDLQVYPVRHGTHANSAFALRLLLAAYSSLDRPDVVTRVEQAARHCYGNDPGYQTAFEPSGADFLSPALCEVELMRSVLPPDEFRAWLDRLLPGLGGPAHAGLLDVPVVRDPTDGHAVHLYGLALSRAWQLRALADSFDAADRAALADALRAAAAAQEAFAVPAITNGHFMSTHWLVSFGLLAAAGLGVGRTEGTVEELNHGRGGRARD